MSETKKKCMYCDKPATRKGLCTTHYFRKRRTGDPLKVRDTWSSRVFKKNKTTYLELVSPNKDKTVLCKIDAEDKTRVEKQNWRYQEQLQNIVITTGKQTLGRYLLRVPVKKYSDKATRHINGDVFDYRKNNLSLVPKSLTRIYRPKHKRYRGVYLMPTGRYYAKIFLNKVLYYLGSFESEDEAAIMYNAKAKELFGVFAVLNDVEE